SGAQPIPAERDAFSRRIRSELAGRCHQRYFFTRCVLSLYFFHLYGPLLLPRSLRMLLRWAAALALLVAHGLCLSWLVWLLDATCTHFTAWLLSTTMVTGAGCMLICVRCWRR